MGKVRTLATDQAAEKGGGRRVLRLPVRPELSAPSLKPLEARDAALAVAAIICLWALVATFSPPFRSLDLAPGARAGLEAATALARLFAALVLFLFPVGHGGQRLRWVAGGFVVLALGGFAFGYLPPVLGSSLSVDSAIYLWLVVRLIAGGLFVVGLLTESPGRLRWTTMAGALVLLALLSGGVLAGEHLLPSLATTPNGWHRALTPDQLTPVIWPLEAVALALAGAALLGAIRQVRVGTVGGWLVIAMVFHAGSQLHGAIWPSPFGPFLTSADVLRDAFAVIVAVGAVIELRRLAEEWASLLAIERRRARGLTEQGVLRANFVAIVAHELGSSIAAIRGVANLLAGGELDPDEARSAITAETDMLSALVSDVQIGTSVDDSTFTIHPEPVALSSLMREAVAFVRLLPGDHPVTWMLDQDTWVEADPARIRQVLRNLLSNAAKYAPVGSRITLRAATGGQSVSIEVADEGPGVPPGEENLIFQKFGRGRSALARAVPGAGLGLYLAARIVEAHGSRLSVTTRPEGGAVFRFDLAHAPVVQELPKSITRSVQVLIVDDHASFRQALARLLVREPEVTAVAQAGTLAGARVLLGDIDLALVDLQLPDGDGCGFIAELKAVHPEIVVLVLTAAETDDTLARAVEAGAVGLLHKSMTTDEILAAVRRAAAGDALLSREEIVRLLRVARHQREQSHDVESALDSLSAREREVLQAVAEGLTDKEVAVRLHIAPATARKHVVNILAKLNCDSRLQAVILAARYGAVDIS